MKKDSIGMAIKSAGKLIWNWLNEPDSSGRPVMDRFLEHLKESSARMKEVLTVENVKIALSYEERSRETITFQALLKQIKSSYALEPGDRICVIKTEKDICVFDAMSVNADDEVQFSSMRPWCRFIVANPDPALIQMFNGTSMLVLK